MRHEIELSFPPLPLTGKKHFVWNSIEWWRRFTAFKRRPTETAIIRLLRDYESFIAFHGARPVDVSAYYLNGLQLADIESMNRRAREIFLSDRWPTITPAILDTAIQRASDIHDKTLFAVIDARECSGHYLIYGSEHLAGLAASMSRELPFDARQILKYFGTPTLFRLSIPRELIPEQQFEQLARYLLEVYWEERNRSNPPRIDWSFIIKEPLPAHCVIDHVHPELIPDPLLNYGSYRYRDNFPCFF